MGQQEVRAELLMTALLGQGRPLCLAKKLGLHPLENGGYSLEGPVLPCDRVSFAFYKTYSGAGHWVSGREVLWGKAWLSLCRGEDGDGGMRRRLPGV